MLFIAQMNKQSWTGRCIYYSRRSTHTTILDINELTNMKKNWHASVCGSMTSSLLMQMSYFKQWHTMTRSAKDITVRHGGIEPTWRTDKEKAHATWVGSKCLSSLVVKSLRVAWVPLSYACTAKNGLITLYNTYIWSIATNQSCSWVIIIYSDFLFKTNVFSNLRY